MKQSKMMLSTVSLVVFGLGFVVCNWDSYKEKDCGLDMDNFRQFTYHAFTRNETYCFAFSPANTLNDFNNARAYCRHWGATLALPKSSQIHLFIKKYITRLKSATWIGLNDMKEEKVFYWDDGHKLGHWDEFPWGEGIHNDNIFQYQEDCVGMTPTGQWHDFLCYYTFPFVCQKQLAQG